MAGLMRPDSYGETPPTALDKILNAAYYIDSIGDEDREKAKAELRKLRYRSGERPEDEDVGAEPHQDEIDFLWRSIIRYGHVCILEHPYPTQEERHLAVQHVNNAVERYFAKLLLDHREAIARHIEATKDEYAPWAAGVVRSYNPRK